MSTDWTEGYFPPGALSSVPEADAFAASWYASQLRALGEPSLRAAMAGACTAYRFLWLRTWGDPVAVRIERWPGAAPTLAAKGGYDPGALALEETRPLAEAAWARFEALLAAAELDTIPAHGVEGLDGSQWIMEAVRQGAYRLVSRWTPARHGRDAAFRRACWFLVELSGLPVTDDDVE